MYLSSLISLLQEERIIVFDFSLCLIPGIEKKFKNAEFPVLICTTHVEVMNEIRLEEHGLVVGASVTLSRIQEAMENAVDSLPGGWKITYFINTV